MDPFKAANKPLSHLSPHNVDYVVWCSTGSHTEKYKGDVMAACSKTTADHGEASTLHWGSKGWGTTRLLTSQS